MDKSDMLEEINKLNVGTKLGDTLEQLLSIVSVIAEKKIKNVLNKVHPIGSYYITQGSENPADLFGGTWEKVTNRFLVGAGGNYAITTTGGEATHVLSNSEMPKHHHVVHIFTGGDTGGTMTAHYANNNDAGYHVAENGAKVAHNWKSSSFQTWGSIEGIEGMGDPAGSTELSGGSAAHNNMPPYLAVYLWRRTA